MRSSIIWRLTSTAKILTLKRMHLKIRKVNHGYVIFANLIEIIIKSGKTNFCKGSQVEHSN